MYMRLIDVSHIAYSNKINIDIETSSYKLLLVLVTDPALCCIFKARCKIRGGVTGYMCYQIIEAQKAKWSFYILTTITFTMCNTQLLLIFLRFASQNKKYKVL